MWQVENVVNGSIVEKTYFKSSVSKYNMLIIIYKQVDNG